MPAVADALAGVPREREVAGVEGPHRRDEGEAAAVGAGGLGLGLHLGDGAEDGHGCRGV